MMAKDSEKQELIEAGWKPSGGVRPFWSHPKLKNGAYQYFCHALYYTREAKKTRGENV
jgi:hypothetical protein